ncbi:uncharacterized protein CG43867 isoform X3 [Zootermopsis nevadensis]|uniref:uncharacterized protein CG43867 isoform X3 n=1 Tax=Zootermopsis nevadensis TaxID=136037 RepID=UPI000B8E3271|nr:uncharacterized protein CG43867 isoform X3 [Zootermopsis nevadensis]
MGEDQQQFRGSPARRLSQLFDPLSRMSEFTCSTPPPSAPASPRLLPRRSRLHLQAGNSSPPPPPPPRPHAASTSVGTPLCSSASPSYLIDLMDVDPSPALPPQYDHWGEDLATASGGINWQERCLELQLELHRFRHQAGRVRDMLREKLSELEQRVVEAESRAEEAEDRVRMMEQRLAEADWTPGETTEHVSSLSSTVQAKETVINKLETQVEEQRLLRLQDAKQVEAKAAKIKEWVTNKLRELEEQNQHLREQNQKCNAQLELLRNHLAHNQLVAGVVKDRSSTGGSSSRASLSLDVTATTTSDDSLVLPLHDLPARPLSSATAQTTENPSLSGRSGVIGMEPAYSEVERRRLQQQQQLGVEIGHSVGGSGSVTVPHIPGVDASSSLLTQDLQAAVESLALLPSSSLPGASVSGGGDETTHDYAEIYTPSHERMPWLGAGAASLSNHRDVSQGGSTSSTNSGGSLSLECAGKPPTPPLHRFPSWESRIYQVAADGLQVVPMGAHTGTADTANNNSLKQPSGSGSAQGYCDISVPVYATVKGRASQIRSMPFTGDSSDDSSDGEGAVTGAGEHNNHGGESSVSAVHHHHHHHHHHHPGSTAANTPASANVTNTRTTNSSSDNTDTSVSTGGSGSSPSKSMKTTSSLSPAKRSSSGSPSKSMKRDTSFESGMSDDYAVPPDALSCCGADTTSIESSMPSLLMRVSSYLDSPNKRVTGESLEKAGHLAKLGGKLKTWRKRWFVLRNGVLTYWKSQNDVNRKPQGQIVLDEICRITRADGAATFEISTGKKTYYLTADSIATMEDWIRVLQNVQRRNATKLLLSKEDNKPTLQGWLTKVKNGHAKKCWCVLIGKMFLYFKIAGDVNPVGQINMRDARVEEVDHVSDSDSEDREGDGHNTELTIGIFPTHQGPTYLLMPSKQEKDSWMYHLTVVSGGGPNAGTQYEQLVQKLMETDGDPNCVLWRHPHLLHSKESIASPLTTLSSEAIQAEAIKLFKSCQLFISVALDSAGIDYHVVLAQNALQQCLDVPELQAELMCALVKQTSRHTQHKIGVQQLLLCATQSLFACDSSSSSGNGGGGSGAGGMQRGSPTSLQATPPPAPPLLDCKTNPPTFVFVQGWQLLALAVSLFIPRNNRLLWYLKLHLHRNADSKSECGKYAAYCQRALERTLQNGGREAKPSRMEVLSILLKNPYHHSLPHAIPVHMLNGAYQVISFDGSTTIEEFLYTLNQEIGCRDSAQSGFTLFSDDPIEKDLEHFIELQAKLCDVISKWETALREKGSGKFENTRVIQLTYKNRLYWRHSAKMETDRERLLLCYQVNQQVIHGRFPLNKELALELAALMAQIDFGEYNSDKGRGSGGATGSPHHLVLQALDKFYPYRYKDGLTPDQLRELQEHLQDKWATLKGRSLLDCVRIYLTCTRKWPHFGASLFQAQLHTPQPWAGVELGTMLWLVVNEDSVTLLELASMQTLAKYPYSAVVTFGGCQDDFMLVVSAEEGVGSQKLLFGLSKPKILELTLLIADYMNALGHGLPGTPQMGTLTRNGSHRSLQRSRQPTTAGGTGYSTLSSTVAVHCSTLGSTSQQQQGQQPDLLKSTPDHQVGAPSATSVEVRLHRTDSKKRTHLDNGMA